MFRPRVFRDGAWCTAGVTDLGQLKHLIAPPLKFVQVRSPYARTRQLCDPRPPPAARLQPATRAG